VGKKASGPAAPSPADYRKQAQQYWGNYGQWTADETARYEKDMARVRATQGAANGPNMSGVFADKRQKEYEARMQELKGGEHGKYLTDYYNEAQKSIAKAYELKPYQPHNEDDYGASIHNRRKARGKYGYEHKLSKEDQALMDRGNQLQQYIYQMKDSDYDYQDYGFGRNRGKSKLSAHESELADINTQLSQRAKAASSMSMEDFYAQQFGTKKAEGMSSEEQAKQRARMAGGRQRTGAGGGAGGAGTVSTATASFGLAPQEEKTTWW